MKIKVKDLKDYIKKAEVGKVIDDKLKSLIHKKIDKSNNYFQRDGSNVPIRDCSTYDFLKELKEELGIK